MKQKTSKQAVKAGGGGKRAVNRHTVQSKVSAGAQERSIERKVRQASKKEVSFERASMAFAVSCKPGGPTMEGFEFMKGGILFQLEFENQVTDRLGRRHYSLHWIADAREDVLDPRVGEDRKKRAQHFFAVPPPRPE